LTTSEPDEQGKTAPIELPSPAPPPPPESAAPTRPPAHQGRGANRRPADQTAGANRPADASATPAERLAPDRALADHAANPSADSLAAERAAADDAANPSTDMSSLTHVTPASEPAWSDERWSEESRSASVAPQVGSFVARPATIAERETLFVPLAVSIGDGFKFGCGFFLASVLVMLIGFVLLAALFVLTTVFGLNLPISR
jgi:hypothetical protein